MKPKSKKGTGYRKESANNKASFWVPGSTSCLSFTLFISRTCFSRFLSSSSFLLPIHVAICNLWVCFLRLELPGEMLTLSGSESSQIPGKQLSLAWFVRDGCHLSRRLCYLGLSWQKATEQGASTIGFCFLMVLDTESPRSSCRHSQHLWDLSPWASDSGLLTMSGVAFTPRLWIGRPWEASFLVSLLVRELIPLWTSHGLI